MVTYLWSIHSTMINVLAHDVHAFKSLHQHMYTALPKGSLTFFFSFTKLHDELHTYTQARHTQYIHKFKNDTYIDKKKFSKSSSSRNQKHNTLFASTPSQPVVVKFNSIINVLATKIVNLLL